MLENSSLQMKLYHYPREKNELINPFNSSDIYLPTKTNLSSNGSISDNSSVTDTSGSSFNNVNQYIKAAKKSVNEQIKENSFLGIKRKIFFNVNKNCKKKLFFVTSNINENSMFNLNNISQDDKIKLNIENSNSQENDSLDKSNEKIRQLEKALPKKEKPKLFYTTNYELFENSYAKGKNEGRWSYEENIKFIKAYVNFGKNYRLSQKYIGTRNRIQIRTHAQKFFKKLKKLKNNDFDFSKDNIKNLSDIFKLIGTKNKSNIDKKEYIINTLISLCGSIQKNEDNYLNKKNEYYLLNDDIKIRKANEEKVDKTIKDPSLYNELNIKKDNYEELLKNKGSNEGKMIIFENDEINNDFLNSNLNLKEDEKEFEPEEIDINKNINIEQNQKKRKNDIFVNENINCNYSVVDNYLNPNIKLDDDDIVLSGDPDLFCLDEISSDINYFSSINNIKSSLINCISDYFS